MQRSIKVELYLHFLRDFTLPKQGHEDVSPQFHATAALSPGNRPYPEEKISYPYREWNSNSLPVQSVS
jgi:hypothetical protein